MDKRVIFSVAGSGKTSYIIDGLEESSRALVVTYTDKNALNLRVRVFRKFGYIPAGIKIYTYYRFLYSFCCKPILGHEIPSKGITWELPPRFAKKTSIEHYVDASRRLYGNRIAKLLDVAGVFPELIERIEKYFDYIYIDEVQDFAGNDFNLLCRLAEADVQQLLVGDFFQHTFDTSRDGNVNGNLHDDYSTYKAKFVEAGFVVDSDLLSHSYRCSPTVCAFVSENLGIDIQSHRADETEVTLIECREHANRIFNCCETVKLFYQASNRYDGFTENWGATKGQNCYEDVCVVLNPSTFKLFQESALKKLAPQTKNKLYVACTRANRHLFFVPEAMYKQHRK
ncbi:DNA helicase UvrD [Halomonas eurihalina]|uniref:DNA 3'-5' helicase II n=1 Tax=Halomonas eurihalina TaxID=42566 RepID=A0A5D9DD53_HALER|nr:DNA helicase UvrD [Halomonas eurihalina]MDR5857980.1 hypothetical protein [Halomonas eurihalina]TZG41509.1 DNA helicase UvrD [Halomonas eurihalina]